MTRTTLVSIFLLTNILFLGMLSCQSKNEEPPIEPEPPVVVVPEPPVTPEPPPVVPEPPEWHIPPMPPVNSEDPTLLPTVKIPMPQDCGWNVGFLSDYGQWRYTYFFINSHKELKELFYCYGTNDNIPTVDFNTYTMLGFVSYYGDTIIQQSLQKESELVYNWHVEVEKTNKGYWELAMLTHKLPQDSRINILIDYKPEPDKEIVNTTLFKLEGCGITNIQSDSVYIINSNEELACESELSQIDFSRQTLLVIFGHSSNGIANIMTELAKTETDYFLTVDVLQNDATVVESWIVTLLTDKITTNYINLNVIYHHN